MITENQSILEESSRADAYHFRVQAKSIPSQTSFPTRHWQGGMTRCTVEHTLAVFCFDEVSCYDSELHEAITHIPLLWGANRGEKTSAVFADMLWSQPPCFAWQSHLPMKTPELLEKQGHSKEKYIAVSEQRKSVIGKYLAVGWGFLVQDRYSCHLKSGDSYNSVKICLKKKTNNPNIKTTANDWDFFSTRLHSLSSWPMNSENLKFRAGDSIHNKTLQYYLTAWNSCVWS